MFKVPNEFRVKEGSLGSDETYGDNGAFTIPFESHTLNVIASDGGDWEHASISLRHRIPNWKEMCFIKNLFWDEEDCIIQYHPPKSEYINNHPKTLHLWRPKKEKIPLPPSIMLGIKELNLTKENKERKIWHMNMNKKLNALIATIPNQTVGNI